MVLHSLCIHLFRRTFPYESHIHSVPSLATMSWGRPSHLRLCLKTLVCFCFPTLYGEGIRGQVLGKLMMVVVQDLIRDLVMSTWPFSVFYFFFFYLFFKTHISTNQWKTNFCSVTRQTIFSISSSLFRGQVLWWVVLQDVTRDLVIRHFNLSCQQPSSVFLFFAKFTSVQINEKPFSNISTRSHGKQFFDQLSFTVAKQLNCPCISLWSALIISSETDGVRSLIVTTGRKRRESSKFKRGLANNRHTVYL